MPVYEFRCLKCRKRFSLTMSVSDRSARKIRCPKCGAAHVEQQYSAVYAVTSRKS